MAIAWIDAESTLLQKNPPGEGNMRRYSLGFVVLAAAVFALPAWGREFRGDSLPCPPTSPTNPYCWESYPDPSIPIPALPLGQSSGSATFFVPSAVTTLYPYLDFFTPAAPPNANFDFVAFYYGDFLAEKGIAFQPVNGPVISQGLLRTGSGDRPLLRVSWFLDDSLAVYTDTFKPYKNDPSDDLEPFHVGIQLIFGIEPDSFQLNGFNNESPTAYRFSASWGCGESQSCSFPEQLIWSGGSEPCDTFSVRDGHCIGLSAVPEPSSIALLGLGFLALVFGMRTANPIRARLS